MFRKAKYWKGLQRFRDAGETEAERAPLQINDPSIQQPISVSECGCMFTQGADLQCEAASGAGSTLRLPPVSGCSSQGYRPKVCPYLATSSSENI